ncbi:NAD(P)/FAD-dependent oxidoreductase [Spirosoma utsteinense]|uniref:NADPH-dependent 2,4-dienoyl-CoA reductase/sulfur reductase-like enzyme n=1 Tax=Spirosoma utsteinense TaxID=2585773 RepID=A0ABR6WA90_9BACT|nr:NAD(P)/FAD-dependent oxidoreductase [Spirosoma utsteinense]MBC3784032.1 NADPH-dependent 2,4-dienoyl-CoA reductase/sulfur reductase-like enzyme [Spirosoma utsteinense]MBC3793479.1 NADPH-dependent 2,4-dienoyl-CoA reductase/sulfur reductase-like enzyme [Spirosoma utsteinense]
MRHIVILGNGIAGITAARELRKQGDDRITVISAETDHFFSRTALMYVYMGQLEFNHTKPYEDWFWTKNRIELLRTQVTDIDFDRHLINCEGNAPVSYDVLILAVGSKPNFFGWPGQELRGVQGLYSKPDLDRMEANTKDIRQAVVVGGGLIGIELCEMLLTRGIQVTFLVRENSFWSSVLPTEESLLVTRHIREHHVDLRTGTELASIIDDGSGRVGSVVLTSGETLPAQFVGVAVGVSPNIDFLKDSPLETDRGILVNERLETNLPNVYAIGDCVQHRTPPACRKPLEQIWYTGQIMGETVASVINQQRVTYQPGVFFNSAKFFDIEYQTYGTVANFLPKDDTEQTFYWEHPAGKLALRINYRQQDQAVTGMNTLGIRQRQAVWQQWIEEGKSIRYVLEHLPLANFDPEFFRQYEAEIVGKFNAENPGQPVTLKAKKGLFNRIFS